MLRNLLITLMVLNTPWAGCKAGSDPDEGSGTTVPSSGSATDEPATDDSASSGTSVAEAESNGAPVGFVGGADFYADRVMVVEDPLSATLELLYFDCVELGPRCRPASCVEPFANNVTAMVGAQVPLWPKPEDGSAYAAGSELSLFWGYHGDPPAPRDAQELSFRFDELDAAENSAAGNFTWRHGPTHVVSDFEADYCPTKVVPREVVPPINEKEYTLGVFLPAWIRPAVLEGTLAGLPFAPYHVTMLHRRDRADLIFFNGPVADPCQGPIGIEFADDFATNPSWPGWGEEGTPPDYFHLEILDTSDVRQAGFLSAQYDNRHRRGRLRATVRWFEPGGYRSTIFSADWSAGVIFDQIEFVPGMIEGRVYLAFDDPAKSFALGIFEAVHCVIDE